MMKAKALKHPFTIFVLSILISWLALILTNLRFFDEIELKITDSKFKQFPSENKPDSSVVLVTIDDSSIQYARDNGISYPWPRVFYARVVDYLKKGGARAILFDMQFYEKDIERSEVSATESDNDLAQSIAQMGKVYLGSQLNLDNRFNFVDMKKNLLQIKGEYTHSYNFEGFIPPIKVLRDSCFAFNPLNILPDVDGVFRRIPFFYNYNNLQIPQIPLKMFADFEDFDKVKVSAKNITVAKTIIPSDAEGNYLINWYQPEVFTNYPFKALLSSASAEMYGESPSLASSIFKDKIVIIGSTAAGLMDDRTSPISKNLAGLEIWATIISNYLASDFVYSSNKFWLFFLFFYISFLILLVSLRFKKVSLYFNFSTLILVIVFDYFLWIKFRTFGNLFVSLLVLFFSYFLAVIINYFLEEKSKTVLRNLFNKYISPDLIQILLNNPSQVELGGKEVNISVLFTDIYNFTDLSETESPIVLVENLNKYLNKLTSFVLDNAGFLDKFTGDGIMALFGTPVHTIKHAYNACMAAVKYKHFYDNLTAEQLQKMYNRFHKQTRIAVHSGKAVVGNLGSAQRMDYTAIGDTVNLSARLEAVNKIYNTQIIVSEDTYLLVRDDFLFRELDTIAVKGRKGATTIFELIDVKNEKPDWVQKYENGLSLYRKRKWTEAKSIFACLKSELNDGASAEMLSRCERLITENPQDWNPVFKLYSK